MKRNISFFVIVSMLIALMISIPVQAGFGGFGGMGQGQSVSEEEIQKMEDAMPTEPTVQPEQPRKLLIFSLSLGFYHSSIPYWNKSLEIMGEKTGAFTAVVSEDPNIFLPENLKEFDAICFNNTVRLTFSPETTPEICESIMDFVKGGKGAIAIHAGVDNFYDWPEAQQMFGNSFSGHPWTAGGSWKVKFDEPDHLLMEPFKGHTGFRIDDEIYRTDPPLYSRDDRLVLMSLDMDDEVNQSVVSDEPDLDMGLSWIRTWENGRIFYGSLGHQHAVTWTSPILEHYLLGIQYALGDIDGVDATPKGTK
ncbi:ThuA domain-containing protein [Planctomycetota bacterium]